MDYDAAVLLSRQMEKVQPAIRYVRERGFMMQKLPTGVRRRKTGLLEKRFSVNGSRYSVYGKTLRQLSKQEQKKRTQIAEAMPLSRKSMTTDQYFEIWIEGKKMSVKPSTIRVYNIYILQTLCQPVYRLFATFRNYQERYFTDTV